MKLRTTGVGLVLAILLGFLLGVGGYTFRYAEGTSYFSSDPRACMNCHIMRGQFDSWQKSGHHQAATCVDCHLPATGVSKYVAKALNGWNHSVAFTLQNFHEPIMIGERNAEILQENCLRCHGDFVHDIARGPTAKQELTQCVHCHSGVGHSGRGH